MKFQTICTHFTNLFLVHDIRNQCEIIYCFVNIYVHNTHLMEENQIYTYQVPHYAGETV